MSNLSLRARISIWTAGVTSAALLVLALATVTYVYLEDLEAIDGHLQGEMMELATDLTNETIDPDEFVIDEFEPWLVLGLFSLDGRRIAATPHFPDELRANSSPADAPFFLPGAQTRWRMLVTTQGEHILAVAHNLTEFDDVQSDLVAAQLLFVPLVAGITAWLSWLVAGRALVPLQVATAAAAGIGSGDLSKRLPVTRKDDEIGRFTAVLNAMLARIEKNYNQARRFAGDASHELSTPLTIIKGEIESSLAFNQLPATTEQRLLSALQEVDRMHQIIDQLLLLARFDAGRASDEFLPVNLSALLDDLAEDIDLLTDVRRINVKAKVESNLHLRGDPVHLRRLLLNLFTNAVKYNDDDGVLTYRLSAKNHQLIFEICNAGPAIAQADHDAIFDRFFQADPSHGQQGSGLGLSLCREIARAHGGEIRLSPSADFANRFVVELPRMTLPATA